MIFIKCNKEVDSKISIFFEIILKYAKIFFLYLRKGRRVVLISYNFPRNKYVLIKFKIFRLFNITSSHLTKEHSKKCNTIELVRKWILFIKKV